MSYLADYAHPTFIRRLLESLAQVACPPMLQKLDLVDEVVDGVELSMRAFPLPVRTALLAGMSTYDLSSMALPWHMGKRASQLSLQKAERYFHSWFHSSIAPMHEFAKGVKGLLCIAFYEQPEVMEAIGYTPFEWVEKKKKERFAVFGPEMEARERAIVAPDPLPGVAPRRRAVRDEKKTGAC